MGIHEYLPQLYSRYYLFERKKFVDNNIKYHRSMLNIKNSFISKKLLNPILIPYIQINKYYNSFLGSVQEKGVILGRYLSPLKVPSNNYNIVNICCNEKKKFLSNLENILEKYRIETITDNIISLPINSFVNIFLLGSLFKKLSFYKLRSNNLYFRNLLKKNSMYQSEIILNLQKIFIPNFINVINKSDLLESKIWYNNHCDNTVEHFLTDLSKNGFSSLNSINKHCNAYFDSNINEITVDKILLSTETSNYENLNVKLLEDFNLVSSLKLRAYEKTINNLNKSISTPYKPYDLNFSLCIQVKNFPNRNKNSNQSFHFFIKEIKLLNINRLII